MGSNVRTLLCITAQVLMIGNMAMADITLHVTGGEPGKKDATSFKQVFAALPEALAKSREFHAPSGKTILLGDGKYFLEKAIDLDSRDSGLTIAASPGAQPVLYGGRTVAGWTKEEGGAMWSAPVPKDWDFRMLVVNGRFCKRARLPASGFFQNRNKWNVRWMSTTGGGWERKPTTNDLTTMEYDPKDLGPWFNVKNAELTVYHMWDESVVGVANVDTNAHVLTFSGLAGHPPGAFGVNKYVVWNLRQGMTEPGQWYHDRTVGRLFYWPMSGENMGKAEVIAPTTDSIIRLNGTKDAPVRSVTIRGLTLSVSNTPLKTGGFGANEFDGALHANFGRDCDFSDLTVVNVGGQGIKVRDSTGFRIRRCHVYQTGACGIMFWEGDNIVEDNHVHNVGMTYPSAIGMWGGGKDGKGNRIANNHIHHVPYTAVACGGTGHTIESNLIHHAMQELHDGAGIYITFCKGITVRGNFIRDITDTGGYGASAYYLDEQAENCLVKGNLSVNVAKPSHNHMAKNNTIKGNVFLNEGDMTLTFPKSSGYVFEGNILRASGRVIFNDAGAISAMTSNVVFSGKQSISGLKGENVQEDPRPVHDGKGRVVFADNPVAARVGMNVLDVSTAGIRKPASQ